jgi:hypothetical protein
MLSSIKNYASSVQTRVSETVTTYTSKDNIDVLLIEATSNDTWSISNQKMYEISDSMAQTEKATKILDHLLLKLKSPPYEWRRILKTLNALDFILKNASLMNLGKL